MGTLVINLNRDRSRVNEIYQSHYPEGKGDQVTFLDFTGSFLEPVIEGSSLVMARSLDHGNMIEKEALFAFYRFGAGVSRTMLHENKSIRQFNVQGMPLYWISNLGFRHYFYSWGENMFFMLAFLRKKQDYLSTFGQVRIILNADAEHLTESLNISVRNLHDNISILGFDRVSTSPLQGLYKGLKNIIGSVVRVRRSVRLRNHAEPVPSLLVATNYPQTWSARSQGDLVLGNLSKFTAKAEPIRYVPLFSNLYDISAWVNDKQYSAHLPMLLSWKTLFRFVGEAIAAYSRISWSRFVTVESKGMHLTKEALRTEMKWALVNNLGLLYQGWVIGSWVRYCQSGCKFFYQDELYPSGRILSFYTKGITGLTTYGYQHGLISKYDLVYKLGQEETEPHKRFTDMIPLPDYLLVWGEYFRKVITETNISLADRIVAVGNLKRTSEPEDTNVAEKGSGQAFRVVWCANMPVFSEKEYDVMEEFLCAGGNYELVIRMHPSFDIRDMIERRMRERRPAVKVSYSSHTDINDDIRLADVVVTNDVSSVFLDAILLDKPVIRIVSNIFLNDSLDLGGQISMLYDVSDAKEFVNTLKRVAERGTLLLPHDIRRDYEAGCEKWKEIVI